LLTVDGAIVDLGTLTWGYRSSGSSVAPYFYANYGGNIAYPGALYTYPIDAVCSQYKVVVRSGATFVDYTLCGDGGSSVDQIQVKDPRYTDAATFKAAMNGVQLVYELATPITYQLTPQEIALLVGTNNIWSTGDSVSVTLSTMDKVTLVNHGKPMNPKINVVSEGSISLLFEIDGTRYTAALSAGEYTLPDLVLFDGSTDVYEAGEGTITYTYPEVSL
jgi:hypothetical protein